MLKIEQYIENKLLIHIDDGPEIMSPPLEQLYTMLGIIKLQIKVEEAKIQIEEAKIANEKSKYGCIP